MSAVAAQMEQQLAPQPEELPRTEKQISLYYGERSEIRELVDRMRAGLPNALAVPDSGIRALATAAYAHDLDPWNGEIWVIYNENKGETSLMAGVKGLRKAAKRQLEERHHYYLDFTPILPEEYPQYGLDTPDQYGRLVELAEICHLRRGDACEQYSKTLRQIFDMCGSFETAREMLGPMPVYVGIGVVRKGEKSKMERCQLVKKRAESDALKRAFDLPFSDRVSGNGDNVTVGNAEDDAIEGEFQVMDEAPRSSGNGHQEPNRVEIPERPMEPKQLRGYFIVRSGERQPVHMTGPITDKQSKVLGGLVKGLFKGSATQDKDAAAYLEYVSGIKEVSGLGKYPASILIDLIKADGDDEWSPSSEAKEEAQRILREVYKDQGQLDMFEQPEPEKKELPAEDEPKSELDKAFPRDKDGNPIDDEPEAGPEPKPEPKQQAVNKPKAEKKPPEQKAGEQPEPAKDNGQDDTLLALQRSNPATWVIAAEMLNKELKTSFAGGELRELASTKLGKKDYEALSPSQGWQAAIEVAREAAKSK